MKMKAQYGTFKPQNESAHLGIASVFSSAITLSNTMIGLGTVTMPFAIKESGFFLGLCMLCLVILGSNFSYKFLVESSRATGCYTFKEIASQAFGSKGAVLAEICVVFYASCSCIAYIRVFADYLPPLFEIVAPNIHFLQNPNLCMAGVMVLTFALASQKTLASGRIFSMCAVFGIGVTALVVFIELMHNGVASDVVWGCKDTFVLSFPLFSVANTGHHNMLRVYKELKDRDQGNRAYNAINLASLICVTIYAFVGIAGYLALGENTPDNILVAYTGTARTGFYFFLVNFSRLSLVFAIACSFKNPHYAVRTGIENVFFSSTANENTKRRIIITSMLVGSFLAIAMAIPSITSAFNFSGSTVGAVMVYFLPPVFWVMLTPKRAGISFLKIRAGAVFLIGVLFAAASLAMQMYQAVQSPTSISA